MEKFLLREGKRLGILAKRKLVGPKTYVGWAKYKNSVLNSLEFESRKVTLKSYPFRLYIDPTNVCNLRCPLCPTGRREMPSPGKMSMETFRGLMDTFQDYVQWVSLYNWGEPLLHKHIWDMVRGITEAGARSVIGSNLNVALTAEHAEEMIASGLSQLVVSIDGATSETYERYRVGGDFDLVLDNLNRLAETKRQLKSPYPDIVLQFIVFRHNEHEIETMAAMARALGAKMWFISAVCDTSIIAEVPPQEAVSRCQEWLPADPQYRRYDESGNWIYHSDACSFLWNSVTFRWDGEVFPCCIPYKDEHSYGNIHRTSFEEIWNGPRYQHARSLFSRTGDVLPGPASICDQCYANKGWNVVLPEWYD